MSLVVFTMRDQSIKLIPLLVTRILDVYLSLVNSLFGINYRIHSNNRPCPYKHSPIIF